MDPHFVLTFGTSLGRSRTLRINNARLGTTETSVRNAMNMIIGSEAVASLRSGLANSRRRAFFVETFITTLDIGV